MWTNLLWSAIAAVLIVLAVIWLRERTSRSVGYPYARRERLLSPHGRHFLQVLDKIVGPDVRVFAKVRVTDVMRVTHPSGSGAFARALARIASQRFDFVLCDRDSLTVLCAVTLDELERRDPGEASFAQSFPAQMCRFAGLPLLRVIARREYDLKDLGDRVTEAVQHGRAHDPAADTSVTMAHQTELAAVPPGDEGSVDTSAQADPPGRASVLTPALMATLTHRSGSGAMAPKCPRCGAAMLRRRVQLATHPDGEFWGCSRFPVCRAITPIGASESRAG